MTDPVAFAVISIPAPGCLDNDGLRRIDDPGASALPAPARYCRELPDMTSPKRYDRIAFVASAGAEAQQALTQLTDLYGNHDPDGADVVVALGGDGLMLQTLHRHMHSGKPIYGMHRGTVGFLMNEYSEQGLVERLAAAQVTVIHPLLMRARDAAGRVHRHRAINEVSLFRQTYQAARLRVLVDGKERLAELVADGVMLATPAGSTAYNLSAQGPILPINAQLLALTPISTFRPRRWRGALLPDTAFVIIEVLEGDKRPVAAVADHDEGLTSFEFRLSGIIRVVHAEMKTNAITTIRFYGFQEIFYFFDCKPYAKRIGFAQTLGIVCPSFLFVRTNQGVNFLFCDRLRRVYGFFFNCVHG